MHTKQPGRPKVNPGEQKAVVKVSKKQSVQRSGVKMQLGDEQRMEGVREEDTDEAGRAN